MSDRAESNNNLVFLHYADYSIAQQVARATAASTRRPVETWSDYNGGVVAVPEWVMLRIEAARRLPMILSERVDDVTVDEAVYLHRIFLCLRNATDLNTLLDVIEQSSAVFPEVDGSSLHPDLSKLIQKISTGHFATETIPDYFKVSECIATRASIGILGETRFRNFLRAAYEFPDFSYVGGFVAAIYDERDPYYLCRYAPHRGITITVTERSGEVFEISVGAFAHHPLLGDAGEEYSFTVEYEGTSVRAIWGGVSVVA